jgi:phosphoribosylformimino-5-aminoimidazole carboxamide ribotide isomerase
MEGPDFDFYREVLSAFADLKVLASGGVRSVDDIKRLHDMGIFAVIFGKSFYEGQLSLKDLEQFFVRS